MELIVNKNMNKTDKKLTLVASTKHFGGKWDYDERPVITINGKDRVLKNLSTKKDRFDSLLYAQRVIYRYKRCFLGFKPPYVNISLSRSCIKCDVCHKGHYLITDFVSDAGITTVCTYCGTEDEFTW